MSESCSLHGADVREGDRLDGRRIRQEDAFNSRKPFNFPLVFLINETSFYNIEEILTNLDFKIREYNLKICSNL